MKKSIPLYALSALIGLVMVGCSQKAAPAPNQPNQLPAGQQNQSSNSSSMSANNPGAQTGTNVPQGNLPASQGTSDLRQLIHDAMTSFSQNPPVSLLAPSVIPTPSSGSSVITQRNWSTASPMPSYNVQFFQDGTPLGGFSGNGYASANDAQQSILTTAGYVDATDTSKYGPQTGQLESGTVDLGKGITGNYYKFTSNNPTAKTTSKFAMILWQEGNWKLEVSVNESLELPVNEAKQVVAYLDTHSLPAPAAKGEGVVVLQVSSFTPHDIQTFVNWQVGNVIYQTRCNTPSVNSIETALDMAVSMSPYHG
ncbi:MAG: hypothetical protein JWN30_2188 [Bacilli bacterium]|nr:hypothetical protein [Bacilli bacterium]